MSLLQSVLAVIGALLALSAVGGGLYAAFRSNDQEARIKRLQSERDDYLSRLNYIEPRLTVVEQQNEVLRTLHNPADQLQALRVQEQTNHDRTVELLEQQHATLQSIDQHLVGRNRS